MPTYGAWRQPEVRCSGGDERMAIAPSMKGLRTVLVRGTGAGVASALAGMNAVRHWAWGNVDARRDGFSWKHTVIGALTHEVAALFWAFCFERLFAPRHRAVTGLRLLSEAAAMST